MKWNCGELCVDYNNNTLGSNENLELWPDYANFASSKCTP